jgi:hypothetical protein
VGPRFYCRPFWHLVHIRSQACDRILCAPTFFKLVKHATFLPGCQLVHARYSLCLRCSHSNCNEYMFAANTSPSSAPQSIVFGVAKRLLHGSYDKQPHRPGHMCAYSPALAPFLASPYRTQIAYNAISVPRPLVTRTILFQLLTDFTEKCTHKLFSLKCDRNSSPDPVSAGYLCFVYFVETRQNP